MLTSDLVRWGRRGLAYIDPRGEDSIDLARALIQLFEDHVGQSRGALHESLASFTGEGTSFLLHRGFAKLLTDRADFATESVRPPEELRKLVFARAALQRQSGTFQRPKVLQEVADALTATESAIETGLYADLESEQRLMAFKGLEATALCDRYNVALVQAALLKASEVTLRLTECPPAKQRALFQKLKFHRLLHRVHCGKNQDVKIQLDGPLSLFRATRRYGMRLANFFPTVLHMPHFQLEARLEMGPRRRAKILKVSDEDPLQSEGRLSGAWQPEEATFIQRRIEELDADWAVEEGGEVLPLGAQGVLVPDLLCTHKPSGKRVWIEVLGTWRKSAVDARLKALAKHVRGDVLVLLSDELAAAREDQVGLEDPRLVRFKKTPNARSVLQRLRSSVTD